MSKLRVIFLVCVVASVTGCIRSCCDDCTYEEEKVPAYANRSGETVKIIAIVEYYTSNGVVLNNHEIFITNYDTLHYAGEEWYRSIPANKSCTFISFGNCGKPTRMEMHFLDDPQKCLVFDGPIKNDGIDIRPWDSYERGKKIPDWANFWAGIEYVYTITPEHRAMAKEEDCQSSVDESTVN
ncbi:MAG: hypothetical protein LBU89_06615 [Fibromonadaceae bacterium]|jgi:hypothetical protein|nr:hypothetical protein [Fibromonadaceae bacterium]